MGGPHGSRTVGACTLGPARRGRQVNRRNLRDAILTLFGVISVVNGAFGNGHLLIAVLGALALAFVAWQRWQTRVSRVGA